MAVVFPPSSPRTEGVVGLACSLGAWGFVLDSLLRTCEEEILRVADDPVLSEFGEAKTLQISDGL